MRIVRSVCPSGVSAIAPGEDVELWARALRGKCLALDAVHVVSGRIREQRAAGCDLRRNGRRHRRCDVVHRRDPARQVLHQMRHVGRPPAGGVVPAGRRRVRLVVADRDVVEVVRVARALADLVERVVREPETLLCRRRLDARPHSEPERRRETRARALLVGAVVVRDQHPVAGGDVAGDGCDVGRRTAERSASRGRTDCRSGR